MSIILNPAKSLSANSTEEFLSESEPSIMQPKNLTGLECMEGMEDESIKNAKHFAVFAGSILNGARKYQ